MKVNSSVTVKWPIFDPQTIIAKGADMRNAEVTFHHHPERFSLRHTAHVKTTVARTESKHIFCNTLRDKELTL